MERIFAQMDSGRPGPLVIIIAALHGNEKVGLQATAAFFERFSAKEINGKVVVLVGNVAAAEQQCRFIDHDLNRFFISQYLNEPHSGVSEWHEARQLIDAVEEQVLLYPQATKRYILDMHSMSGEGIPFTCFPNSQQNDALARRIYLPAIAGIVEFLPGTLAEYFNRHFDSILVAECGQHDAPKTLDNGVAILIHYLHLIDVLQSSACHREAKQVLMHNTQGYWDVFTRVRYRYHIENRTHFEMQPGFSNLQKVCQETLLARDGSHLIYAPFDARIVLPCYQKQGDDGFFLAVDE
ncbi:MAG: succinylglutamate desuccinylase/aspartoacylase family protein [Aestuariibacter sp.]